MKKRILGRTGLEVSEISFGAWQLGGVSYGAVSEQDADATLSTYIDRGGNFIDTARRYAKSEYRIGKFLKNHGGRDQLILASKTHQLDEALIREELETSLSLLSTDYLDLYYLHLPPDGSEQMMDVLRIFEQLKEEGKIRFIGASIKGPDVTPHTVELSRQYTDSGNVDVLMLIYSIVRQGNSAVFDATERNGIGIVARTVLESGLLSGKYKPGHRFENTEDHRRRWSDETLDRFFESAVEIQKLIEGSPCKNTIEAAIRFALQPPAVSSLVIGGRTPAQIQQILDDAEAGLLPAEFTALLREKYAGRDSLFNIG